MHQPDPNGQGERRERALGQYFTPRWAAERLLEQFFSDLGPRDYIVEPSCGDGAFLGAIPEIIPAIGVELDPELAVAAAANTGRPVLCGDFRFIDLPEQPTAIVGNPPFQTRLINEFLDRARGLLPDNGRCGFILPAYAFQHAGRVWDWAQGWGMEQTLIPRNLFPQLSKPLVFCLFTKSSFRFLKGFSLYRECVELRKVRPSFRLLLVHGRSRHGGWRPVVEAALRELGGEADLDDIYRVVEPRRPSDNRWWHEKVRQVLHRGEAFVRVDKARWRCRNSDVGNGVGEQLPLAYSVS